MPALKKHDIIIQTQTHGGLRVAIGDILVTRAQLRPVEIPRMYRGQRVGVELVVRGRPLPPMLNTRLLSTAYDVFVHQNGATSIPFEAARRMPVLRASALP